ncbi:MAG: hypothetical protein ABI647_06890 [Gemmatimonadota bacterium]
MEISGSRIGYSQPALTPPSRPAIERTVRTPDAAEATSSKSLRDVLTAEERAYFEQLHDFGPITYSPRARQSAPPSGPVGQRIDARA